MTIKTLPEIKRAALGVADVMLRVEQYGDHGDAVNEIAQSVGILAKAVSALVELDPKPVAPVQEPADVQIRLDHLPSGTAFRFWELVHPAHVREVYVKLRGHVYLEESRDQTLQNGPYNVVRVVSATGQPEATFLDVPEDTLVQVLSDITLVRR